MAILVVSGCQAAPPPTEPATLLRARGNEPGWHVAITADALEFGMQERASRASYGRPVVTRSKAVRAMARARGESAITITAWDRLCADTIDRHALPVCVEVDRRGDPQVLRGCGGEPATLLKRNQWQVASINSVDVPTDARETLVFGNDGRVSGRAFCNSYSGTYVLTGEGLSFAQGATTMMACASRSRAWKPAFSPYWASCSASRSHRRARWSCTQVMAVT